jgi:hypothetical protein
VSSATGESSWATRRWNRRFFICDQDYHTSCKDMRYEDLFSSAFAPPRYRYCYGPVLSSPRKNSHAPPLQECLRYRCPCRWNFQGHIIAATEKLRYLSDNCERIRLDILKLQPQYLSRIRLCLPPPCLHPLKPTPMWYVAG